MENHVSGIHFILDMVDCQCHPKYFIETPIIELWFKNVIAQSGLTPLDFKFYSFGQGHGYTGFIPLAESHVSIHTWPGYSSGKFNVINSDIFVCNVTMNNESKATFIKDELLKLFDPIEHKLQTIYR